MAAIALFVSSCTQNEEIAPIEEKGRIPVEFVAKNVIDLETRAAQNLDSWKSYHLIGITMLAEDGTVLDANNIYKIQQEDNDKTTASLVPRSDADKLYYPTNGSNVIFRAYCLRDKEATDNKLTIDLTQLEAGWNGEMDLMTTTEASSSQTYNENTEGAVELQFEHRFALLDLMATSVPAEGGNPTIDNSAMNATTVSLSNQYGKVEYDITTDEFTPVGEKITLKCALKGIVGGYGAEFYLVPGVVEAEASQLTFVVGDEYNSTFVANLPAGTYERGKKYSYTARLIQTKTEGSFSGDWNDWTPATIEENELTPTEVPVEP